MTLREQLQHVYWMGGGSAAGKSTIARRIAAQHGFRLYATDDVMTDHDCFYMKLMVSHPRPEITS